MSDTTSAFYVKVQVDGVWESAGFFRTQSRATQVAEILSTQLRRTAAVRNALGETICEFSANRGGHAPHGALVATA